MGATATRARQDLIVKHGVNELVNSLRQPSQGLPQQGLPQQHAQHTQQYHQQLHQHLQQQQQLQHQQFQQRPFFKCMIVYNV